MRAPDFWSKDDPRSRLLASALSPLGAIYNATVRWKAEHTDSYRTRTPVICIGNISAGGTGKTPVAIAIAEALNARGRKPVFLSRGYGGRLAGPVLVTLEHRAVDVGDEPLLLARVAPTVVSRDRRTGAQFVELSGADVIVMDDGHQNFTLAKDIAIVVVDAEKGFGNRRVLPAGPLRETIAQGLRRADAVVLTGDGDPKLNGFTGPVLHARLQPVLADSWRERRVLAFSGIGRPDKFFRTVQETGAELVGMVAFPDHHPFTTHQLLKLRSQAHNKNAQLVTTEKDFVRIGSRDREEIDVLPVRAEFEQQEALRHLLDRLLTPR